MTPVAAVSWAAYLGWLPLQGTWLAWLGNPVSAFVFGAGALAELVVDKLPSTPSRKMAMGFGARVVTGALCGAALATPAGSMIIGILAGAIGAVIGTLGGAALRARLAQAIGKDFPAALIEDLIAIGGAILIVSR